MTQEVLKLDMKEKGRKKALIRKEILSVLFVSLLTISTFSLIPFASAYTYTLTVEAAVEHRITSYEDSVKIAPGPDPFDPENPEPYEILQPITVGVYLTNYCSPGGLKKDTKAHYVELVESQNSEIKVPVSALEGQWKVLFEHWEVWDNTTDAPLEWLGGINEQYIYVGEWEHQDVTYTRITKLIATPKYNRVIRPEIEWNLEAKYQAAQKELLGRSDGILEPYLRFGIHNPEGGGDKLLIAVYHLSWGPETEHMYFQTVLGPDATRAGFLNHELDAVTDLLNPYDISDFSGMSTITSTPGFHVSGLIFNLRLDWLGPRDGGEPGKSLRKAIAYLLPKDRLIALLFKYAVMPADTICPPSLELWYNPNVNKYEYNSAAAYYTLQTGGYRYEPLLGTWYHDLNSNGAYDLGERVVGGADAKLQISCALEQVSPTSFTIAGILQEELVGLRDPLGNLTPIAAERQPLDSYTLHKIVYVYQTFEVANVQDLMSVGRDAATWALVGYVIYNFAWEIYKMVNPDYVSPRGGNPTGINDLGVRSIIVDFLKLIAIFHILSAKNASFQLQNILSDLVAHIPVYSKNYFSAHQYDCYGMVLTPGVGTYNLWSKLNLKGPRESSLYVPPLTQIQGNEIIMHLADYMEGRLNPAEICSAYATNVASVIWEGLLNYNPYTLEDLPGLAKSWQFMGPVNMTTPNGAKIVNGMYFEFTLDDRVVENKVLWHDGEVFNADDIIFSWNYVWENQLLNYVIFWEDLVDVDSPSPDRVGAYWNATSWHLYDAAGTAALFAPQVWGKLDTDNDGLNYLDDGDVEGDTSIRAWPLADHGRSELGSYPAQAVFPWLSQAIGTGPYVLYSASEDGYHSDLFAFDTRSHTTVVPDVHYWKTKAEIKEQEVEMFYHLGDVSLDAIVDTLDLARMGSHLFETGPTYPSGDYRGFIQEDVTEDGRIDILDLSTAGKNFGKEQEY